MIKLIRIEVCGPRALALYFSDGSHGEWSAEQILAHDTVLTRPLEREAYFRRAFIEAGALAWPNGLDFSARSLHEELARANKLKSAHAA
ncbi:DUF2442 domain-containing protein [Pelagerythrobacter marensis]|uniref:DUF2442 domain-containing protein n=1 Tax=Pelagerythrobacter marensis TaxID=543877 RepID=A0A0G3XBN7_9SPHN|nr:DUF2442 domain-containing protein [Pelagerythrobacter marensis]AKM08577.1 hypothetical protein AM2010_2522 [Pelagerythrobacter marensis]